MSSARSLPILLALLLAIGLVPDASAQQRTRTAPDKETTVRPGSIPSWLMRPPRGEIDRDEMARAFPGTRMHVSGKVLGRTVDIRSSAAVMSHGMHEIAGPTAGNQYAYPALVEAANGDLLMAFKDWGDFPSFSGPPVDPAKLYMVRSTDGGTTWGDPVEIDRDDWILDFNFLELTRLGSGRLLLNDLTPGDVDHYYYSDDNGETWVATPIEELWNPSWHGPIDGQVWYTHWNPDNGSLLFRTSSDGLTWSEDRTFLSNGNPNRYDYIWNTAGSAGGSNVVVIYSRIDNQTGIRTIYSRRSTDGGATWANATPIDVGDMDFNAGAIDRAEDGTLWLVGSGWPPCCPGTPLDGSGDIYTMTSTDNGATWSTPSRFTSYLGEDYTPDLVMTAGGPVVAFASSRTAPGVVAYGIAGQTSDDNAPPAVFLWVGPFGGARSGEASDFVILAGSGSAITSAEVTVTVDGSPTTIPLTSGGSTCAEYDLPDPNCWHTTVGPFEVGQDVTISASATDADGRSAGTSVETVNILVAHNAGAVDMVVYPTGEFGQVIYDGYNYMCCGGHWAGSSVGGGTVTTDWMWQSDPDFRTTAAPGKSDLDIAIGYSDAGLLGLDVVQRSYQWASGPASNGILFEYEYTNNGSVGAIDDLYSGMSLDADLADLVWEWWADDLIGYSEADRLIYMYDSGELCATAEDPCPTGYIGVAIVADATGHDGSARLPYTARNGNVEGSAFEILAGGIDPSLGNGNPSDYRMALTAQPFALAAGASQKVAFALVFGKGLEELVSNAEALAAAYDSQVTGVEHAVAGEIPSSFSLDQNYPNPFNPVTTFRFAMPTAAKATLTVYNLIGEEVATLVSGDLAAGIHDVRWDASGLASGVYLYRLTTDASFSQTRSLVLLK